MDTERKPIEVKVEVVNQDSPQVKPYNLAYTVEESVNGYPPTTKTQPKLDITAQEPVNSVITVKKTGKEKRMANLRPWPKGVSGRAKGPDKGTVQLKPLLEKTLNKQKAQAFVDNLIEGAISGSDSKQERILKMSGQFEEKTPQINIQNNTLNITDEILALARKMLIEERKQINES